MSTSKRNVTREVLLERERGKAGASWLYADHVVVLREFTRCMRGQRSSSGFFVIFIYFFFLCQGNVSLAVIPLGTASLGGRPFDVSLCRLSLLVLLHVCFRIEARPFPAISSRPQHMYWAWEMIIKAHHPQAGRQTAKWYRPDISNVSAMGFCFFFLVIINVRLLLPVVFTIDQPVSC